MNIENNIFREYDIRGIASIDLTDEAVFKIGQAYGTIAQNKKIIKVAIGQDVRLSSPYIANNLIKGIISTGLDVIDLGICPTPLLYFALYQLEIGGGIMVTGSHNPPEYNGLKLCLGKDTIYGKEIQNIRKVIEEESFRQGNGKVSNFNITTEYINYLLHKFQDLKNDNYKIKVVIDCGNGTGGLVAPEILKSLNCEVIELYSKPDGNFPNHHPDPTVPEYLQDLIKTTMKEKADAGIAYDGDTDRIGVVDELGNIIWGDKLMIIFSREILKNNPKAKFIGEVKCSDLMYQDIQNHGGTPIMWKTGHSLIKAKMKEEQALLAGEMSGHMFFADRYFGFDDAIYTTCRLIETLKHNKRKLSDLLADLHSTFSTPEIRVDCPDHLKFKIVEEIKNKFKDKYEIIDIDGVRIKFSDGWGLIRASNTQPVLVLRFEATSNNHLNKIRNLIEDRLFKIIKIYC
ncbi:MAG: phosphomannomutase/phosphoglucomutase [bacterium]|nr:phosphomannomutase/phosphoglucomutase [bacterium]